MTEPTEREAEQPAREAQPGWNAQAADDVQAGSEAAEPAESPDTASADSDGFAQSATSPVAAERTAPARESSEPAEHGGDGWSGNGHSEDTTHRLPPPWERVPTEVSTAHGSSTEGSAAAGGYGKVATATATATAPARPQQPTEYPAEHPEEQPGARRDAPADLGDARTVGVEHRGGQVTPPGGFPMSWPRNRRPRQANLQLKRLDPWSVLKIALVLAVVLYLVWLVAIGVLYGALDGIGVWERLNGQYADLVAEHAGDRLISAGRVFGVAAVVGAVNSLLFAVALSVGAFIYNVSADLVGGLEVTLSERD